jgi:peptidoglycan/LPS O-acetylase OafA/YrhL
VFSQSPRGTSVNSSLWSLSLEWKCYAGLFLISFIRRRSLNTALLWLLLVLLIIVSGFRDPIEPATQNVLWPHFHLYPYTRLTAYFVIGVLCYRYRRNIPIYSWGPVAILLAGWLAALSGTFYYAAYLLLPAMILSLAFMAPALLRYLTPKPDLSYGFYLWAFPVEQLVANYLHPSTPIGLFLLTTLLTLPLALLSWYVIESPALKKKKAVR